MAGFSGCGGNETPRSRNPQIHVTSSAVLPKTPGLSWCLPITDSHTLPEYPHSFNPQDASLASI